MRKTAFNCFLLLASLLSGRDVCGQLPALQQQQLDAAEYFWDTDPGQGNGSPVTIPAGETWTLGSADGLSIDIAQLAGGTHQFGLRVKDIGGRWGEVNWLPIQIQDVTGLLNGVTSWGPAESDKLLVAAEYFWDTDPGLGNGTATSVPEGETWTLDTNSPNVAITQLSGGLHQLGLRVKDDGGRWSEVAWMPFAVTPSATVLVNNQSSLSNSFAIPATNSIQVTLQTTPPYVYIFYTLDGSEPDADSMLYTAPFTITNSVIVRTHVYNDDGSIDSEDAPVTINVVPLYTLADMTPGGGSVAFSPAGGLYLSNTLVTVTATPSNGWTFMNWAGAASGTNNSATVVMTGPRSVSAVLGTTITTNAPTGGGIALWPPQGPYPYGTIVRLVGMPAAGKYFSRWFNFLTGPTNNPYDLAILTNNPVVSATFNTLAAGNYTLTTLLNGSGTVTRSPYASFYVSNTTVQVTAVPDAGYAFTGWSGNAGGTQNPLPVTLNSNKVITASFASTVLPVNQPPMVGITNPIAGATFTAPVNINLSAVASDPDGSVTQVAFLNGASQLGAVTNVPYSFTWTNAPVGTNVLTAVATDNGGLSTTSAPVSIVVQTALPQIALISPTNGATYYIPASFPVSAIASDADNSIARVELYALAATNGAQIFLLSAITNPPFNFTWSGMPAGGYTLTARAIDSYGPIVTSAPVSLTVSPPPSTNPPVFLFSAANYSVNESNGLVVVTVQNSGDLGGLVNYTTHDGTAHGGSGFSGDYTISQGSLLFTGGQHATNLVIGIRDNFLSGSDIQFTVQLFNPGAGALGSPATTTVTIHENDIGGATNSLVAFASPAAQPATSGSLTVVLTPPEALGQWRFPWELGWRSGGQTAASLEAGNYPVQLRNVANYLAFPPSLTVAVTNGGGTYVTNQYLPTYTPVDATNTGSLTVNLPNAPGGAGWRFIGETAWRLPNTGAGSLLPDVYFIEFEPVSLYSKPASRAEQVFGGQATVVSDSYLLASALPVGASPPSQISPGLITDLADYPYGFNGQLHTDAGYGSGVAVRETVVLTAAHMVFNDQTLAYVNQAYWSFQEEAGTFEPEPLAARGWYVLGGYAAQRTNDLQVGGYGVDQSSPQSRELDVAALYFLTPAARGGYGGYLTSDTVPNPWLTGANLKMLVGYPVDGSQFGDASIVPGRMYTTPAQPPTTALTPVGGDVYTAGWFLSYPGNSGGPLYVKFNNYYYPAGVYLGTLGSGQSSVSVVRAINSDVVNLINLASSLGDTGTNHTGGGVVTLIAGAVTAANPAYVQVQLGPPAAVLAGAGWRLQGDPAYGTAVNYIRAITSTNAALEFKPVAGWNPPAGQAVQVSPGALSVITNLTYTVVPPVFSASPATGISLTGTTGTTYRIEYRTSLAAGAWQPLATNTLGAGLNPVLPWPPTNGPAAWFRAVWLP